MSESSYPSHCQPCLWMTAGVVSYKLCDRDFDCEHCPLDAALRGRAVSPPAGDAVPRPPSWHFPADRVYTTGHTWLAAQEGDGAALRFGLDVFGAGLLGRIRRVVTAAAGSSAAAGETVCEIDVEAGLVPLAAPVACRLRGANEALSADPRPVLSSPYERGWLLALEPDDPAVVFHLLAAEAAEAQARLDLRHFRRRAALHLLDDCGVGPTLPDGGEPLMDLRLILGGPRYVELLRELVH